MKTTQITPLLKSWKINELINVNSPINEHTKILPSKWCHHNACNTQSKFGGEVVLGFLIEDIGDYYWFVPHSIWKDEENQYIDVTFHDNKNRFFAPLIFFNSLEVSWLLQQEYKIYKDPKKGIDWLMPNRPVKNLTSDELENIDFHSLVFKRNYPITETESWDDYLEELDEEISSRSN